MRVLVVLFMAGLSVACEPFEAADAHIDFDAGLTDAGAVDGGPGDAGPLDAGQLDAGQLDAGQLDAGLADAGERDAGVLDGGQPDGPPTRRACTNTLGTGLSTAHGRLDGVLVAVVPPSARSCNADSTHVHLQVLAGGAVYDVAVNVTNDVLFFARPGGELGPDFGEGWHPFLKLGYRNLGLRSTDFSPMTTSQLVQTLQAELSQVNHISVFGSGYGPDGMHNVHFQEGYSYDGAIILRPLSSNARQLFFRFTPDVF